MKQVTLHGEQEVPKKRDALDKVQGRSKRDGRGRPLIIFCQVIFFLDYLFNGTFFPIKEFRRNFFA